MTPARFRPVPGALFIMGALLLAALPSSDASAGPAALVPRILLHARRVSQPGALCSPLITRCVQAETSGLLYLPAKLGNYYVYLMAGNFDAAVGAHEVFVGLDYDRNTLSGVDIFSWHLCADSEAPSARWYQEGGSNRISWGAENCQHDSLAVGGYFYLTSYTDGRIALIPPPEGGSATFTPCGGAAVDVPRTALGYIGFGLLDGCNPCLKDCDYVPVIPTTWSSIKSQFRSP